MAVIKNKTSDANREYWTHIEEVAKEVGKWPQWMGKRNEDSKVDAKSESVRARAVNASDGSAPNSE